MKEKDYPSAPQGGFVFFSPERRETLICPDCGDVTTVNYQLLAASLILCGNKPPICTRCGTSYIVFQQTNTTQY